MTLCRPMSGMNPEIRSASLSAASTTLLALKISTSLIVTSSWPLVRLPSETVMHGLEMGGGIWRTVMIIHSGLALRGQLPRIFTWASEMPLRISKARAAVKVLDSMSRSVSSSNTMAEMFMAMSVWMVEWTYLGWGASHRGHWRRVLHMLEMNSRRSLGFTSWSRGSSSKMSTNRCEQKTQTHRNIFTTVPIMQKWYMGIARSMCPK